MPYFSFVITQILTLQASPNSNCELYCNAATHKLKVINNTMIGKQHTKDVMEGRSVGDHVQEVWINDHAFMQMGLEKNGISFQEEAFDKDVEKEGVRFENEREETTCKGIIKDELCVGLKQVTRIFFLFINAHSLSLSINSMVLHNFRLLFDVNLLCLKM